jgi:hypothetical protein
MDQHNNNELDWWRERGVADPFALCLDYYRRFKKENGNG